jgi:transketolase
LRNRFAELLYESAVKDDRIHIVVADISPAGSMQKFREEFPSRFINVGVSEQSMIGICAGLASEGAIPFAYSIATFSLIRPYEFIRDDISLHHLPVTIVGIGGGLIYSTLGPTHHAQEDVALASLLPGMNVATPADSEEVVGIMDWLLRSETHPGPTYLRLGKAGEPSIDSQDLGWVAPDPRILRSAPGSDLLLITYGTITPRVMKVADGLASQFGVSAMVVSLPVVKPIPWKKLEELIAGIGMVVVIEEHVPLGSIAMQIKAQWANNENFPRVHSISLADRFYKFYGSYEEILNFAGMSIENMTSSIHQIYKMTMK